MARPRRIAASRTRKRIARISSKTRAEDSSDSDYQYDEGSEEDVPLEAGRAKKKPAQRPIRSISSVTDVSQSSVSNDDSEYESLESNLDSGDAFNSDVSEEEIIEKIVARPASKKTSRSRKCRKKLKSDDKKKLEWEKWEEELSNWCPWGGDDDDFDMDAVVQKDFPQPEMEPSSDLLMPLLPFQKEWLAWSLKQEESTTRGGILADEMGMGKTIQAISLILTSKELACGHHIDSPELFSTELAKKLPEIKATLVVCPLIAVTQWENEISKFTKEGSLKVLIYHGARRNINIEQLADYDVVLTTYSTVESEHRRFVRPPKEKCKWCGKLFLPDRIGLHLRYFCGPTAQKSEKQSKQVRKNKTNSAHKGKKANNEKNALKNSEETVYKGSGDENRKRKRKSVSEVFSLDDLHESNLKPGGNENASGTAKASSLLHSVKWLRIILDEAHSIKNRTCSTAKAIFALKSTYKWALSGTPLQNRVGELYSLVRFLEISPYSYYFCRKCDCKSLDYNFRNGFRTCETCQHGPLLHFSWWNKFVANPIKRWGYVHRGRKALMLLKYKVLEATLLRRTKTERAADLTLPPRTTFLRRDAFDPREEDFYQALYTQSQSQFNTYVTSGTLLNNYAHIFDLLTRLRQAVDHPYLVVYSATAGASIIQSQRSLNSTAVEESCGICHDPIDDPVSTACGHLFCKSCIEEYTAAVGSIEDDEHGPQCPTCQKALTIDLTKNHSSQKELAGKLTGRKRSSILHRIDLKQFQTCTKIEALKEEIMLMLEKDGAAKAIVFSQFTSMLELIGYSLQTAGFQCVKLDGSMSMAARDQMIEKFRNDPGCKVFLMSLKAGGVALNLTVASHVFLMDPWWNPAVEKQAQDRIHRIGQYKPIRVIRFVIENTIEERILKLQEKKQLVFEGTVGGSSEALGRLTEEDLRFLFHS